MLEERFLAFEAAFDGAGEDWSAVASAVQPLLPSLDGTDETAPGAKASGVMVYFRSPFKVRGRRRRLPAFALPSKLAGR